MAASGEVEHEGGVPTLCAGRQQRDGALRGGHDLAAYRKAQSGAFPLGGEEGGEGVVEFSLRYGR